MHGEAYVINIYINHVGVSDRVQTIFSPPDTTQVLHINKNLRHPPNQVKNVLVSLNLNHVSSKTTHVFFFTKERRELRKLFKAFPTPTNRGKNVFHSLKIPPKSPPQNDQKISQTPPTQKYPLLLNKDKFHHLCDITSLPLKNLC